MSNNPVLVANPGAHTAAYRPEIDAAIKRVLDSGWYILGKEVEGFEKEFASYIGTQHCVGVANGTDAIAIILQAAGIGLGDEVITTSHSAVATTAAIEQVGATPVFADIDPETFTLDPVSVESRISSKTKALAPVHIYGHPVDIPAFQKIALEKDLFLLEDCAQAHGAKFKGNSIGRFGHAASYSFYPTKNLGAIGDGGGITTDVDTFAEEMKALRQYGWKERYVSSIGGVNSRLDELQAAILRVKLKGLHKDIARRQEIAARYNEALENQESILAPKVKADYEHAYHLYVVLAEDRQKLEQHLKAESINSTYHYPLAIHQQSAYAQRIRGGDDLPVTEHVYKNVLSLPMYPELTEKEIARVCKALESF